MGKRFDAVVAAAQEILDVAHKEPHVFAECRMTGEKMCDVFYRWMKTAMYDQMVLMGDEVDREE